MPYDQHKLLLPEHLVISLRQLGMEEMEFTFWQHATDFLRERYDTYLVVVPVDKPGEKGVIAFDFHIHSPHGEEWETEGWNADYYGAMTDGIEACIQGIQEANLFTKH